MRTWASAIFLASSSCEESNNRVKLRLEYIEKTAAQLIDIGEVLETKLNSRESFWFLEKKTRGEWGGGEIPFGIIVQLVVPGEHHRGPIGIRGESHFPEIEWKINNYESDGKDRI